MINRAADTEAGSPRHRGRLRHRGRRPLRLRTRARNHRPSRGRRRGTCHRRRQRTHPGHVKVLTARPRKPGNIQIKSPSAVWPRGFLISSIGVTRFELATSTPPALRSNQAELHPVAAKHCTGSPAESKTERLSACQRGFSRLRTPIRLGIRPMLRLKTAKPARCRDSAYFTAPATFRTPGTAPVLLEGHSRISDSSLVLFVAPAESKPIASDGHPIPRLQSHPIAASRPCRKLRGHPLWRDANPRNLCREPD